MNGDLPWQVAGKRLPNDLKYFRKMTTETRDPSKVNAVVFGRRTWESVPEKHRPLKNRINYVLTRNEQWARENLPEGVYSFPSLNDAVCHMQTDSTVCTRIEKAVIVGGVQLFEER
jgi:dihydrofolate reductase